MLSRVLRARRASAANASSCGKRLSRRYASAINHVAALREIVGRDRVLFEGCDIEKYVNDWLGGYKGGSLVCLPTSTAQISALLAYCNEHGIGVVPQGGNTGLVGGSVGTERGELILSLARMDRILSLDATAGTMVCEAGCVLESLNEAARAQGFQVPLDLGAKGSCMIGGNFATNAGGLRVVKFGSLHSCLLGMEVVLANGQVLDMLRGLHKDNTGYHLPHLFVGSEGTLGVITKLCFKLAVLPKSSHVLLAKVKDFATVCELLRVARRDLGETLSAFEFVDEPSLAAVQQTSPHLLKSLGQSLLPQPDSLDTRAPLSVVMEVAGSSPQLDLQRLEIFLETLAEQQLVVDAVLSQDEAQEKSLWSIREHVPVSLLALSRLTDATPDPAVQVAGKLFKYDLSLPLEDVPIFLDELQCALELQKFQVRRGAAGYAAWKSDVAGAFFSAAALQDRALLQMYAFGHAGDQNIHLNVIGRLAECAGASAAADARAAAMASLQSALEEAVYPLIVRRRGSLSAEHGVGQQKKKALLLTRSSEEVLVMRALKAALDPKHTLNPGKLL